MNSLFQLKLFIGYFQNNALKTHLHQSHTWKEAQVTPGGLKQTIREEKSYIGLYTALPLSLQEIRLQAQTVKELLQKHCPNLDLDSQTIYLFAETFLT